MELFREALEDCYLNDLGYVGSRYSWSNKHQDGGFTKERLHKAIANQSWCDLFQTVCVHVLAAQTSDHKPLIVSCGISAWEESGLDSSPIQGARKKLEQCQTDLRGWNKRKFWKTEEEVRKKSKQREALQGRENSYNQEEI
ncbi:uncharacterized protein LOC132178008 [Corylus avellana]|uniref:uncharacterized protein LOC132178008 n=1 Tax=Corylus avellana TaxID=13451 RepID=UPI00286C08B7|nr:uncharacterized protein LOC132178008 [Corylus avellana]